MKSSVSIKLFHRESCRLTIHHNWYSIISNAFQHRIYRNSTKLNINQSCFQSCKQYMHYCYNFKSRHIIRLDLFGTISSNVTTMKGSQNYNQKRYYRLNHDVQPSQQSHSCNLVPTNEVSLYFHYPYCNKMCGYCNFNKFLKTRSQNPSDSKLLDAYLKSVENIRNSQYYSQWEDIGKPLRLRSVFFGGGTPSLGDPKMYKELITNIRELFPNIVPSGASNDLEISLELNPTLATPSTLHELKDAGINRLSVGIQSLRDDDLKFLGREHSSEQAKIILEDAIQLFNGNVSADLMFGLPSHHRTIEAFIHCSLLPLLDMGLKHISLYELTIEKGTPFYKLYMMQEKMDEDVLASLYEACITKCKEYGLYQYEVSNFAASSKDECVHNISYWGGIDYIGIGPGAHSRVTNINSNKRFEVIQFAKPEDWHFECTTSTPVESKLNTLISWRGNSKIKEINHKQRFQEIVMVALRMPHAGLSEDMLKLHTNDPEASLHNNMYLNKTKIDLLVREGLLHFTKMNDTEYLQATENGIRVLNGIINEIV